MALLRMEGRRKIMRPENLDEGFSGRRSDPWGWERSSGEGLPLRARGGSPADTGWRPGGGGVGGLARWELVEVLLSRREQTEVLGQEVVDSS